MIKKITHLLLFFIPIICCSQVTYNFESGSLTGWLQVPDAHWSASSSSPLSGSYSLKHTFNSTTSSTDRVSVALPSWNPNAGDITWQVKVRHGYDPSSSNRWWIYLMADQDANQMQLGGACSGYAIGVNLIGSDDLLKLYKFDKGVPQVVLTTTLNWETQIGKSLPGAIEIERKRNGTFTLRASTSGSFTSLINYGSAVESSISHFLFFGVCFSYTSTGDLLLWVDDISFNFSPLNKHDLTSEILSPTNQVSAGVVSSTANNPTDAVVIMKFKVKDNSTLDNLPTRVKSITLKKAISLNSSNWIKTIGGVQLREDAGEVSIINQTIRADNINLTLDSTSFEIPNGQNKEYSLSLYLKPDSLEDGSSLKVMIDSAHHGFMAGLSGSDFSNTFPCKVISNEFKIDVLTSSLKVTQLPAGVSKNTSFTFSVGGADNNGNIDKDFSNPIKLCLSQGSGLLTSISGLTKPPIAGVSVWADLKYSTLGSFRVLATSVGVGSVESQAIKVLNDSTSIILSPANQPEGTAISSLKAYPAEATEILRVRFRDLGETDGLPTIVKNVKLSRTEIPDVVSLSKSIGGVLVKVNDNLIGISDLDIKTNYLAFSIDNNLIVPDGGSVDASFFIYLKENGLVDGQRIQLKVDSTNHGFIADPLGSRFSKAFSQKIFSNIFTVDVVATQLKFTAIPTRVGVLQPFSVIVSTTDLNGNTDKDFLGSMNLSLYTGSGSLAIPSISAQPITQGNCTFSTLTYSKPERFSLLASCSTLNSVASSSITCGDTDGGVYSSSESTNSVLVKGISVTPQDAVEVLRLNVFDSGTSDGLQLLPSKISLHCFDPTKAELLNRQIGGFVLKENNKIINLESYSLNNGVFEITPVEGDFVIENGDTIALSISIYLKKGEALDNFPFRFYVPDADHGWESISLGTGFASNFSSSVYGHECKIIVKATNLKFINTPFLASLSKPFALGVNSTDRFGSVDVDFNDQLTLDLQCGAGSFSCSGIKQDLASGYAGWSDVRLGSVGTYCFKAKGVALSESFSDVIYCGMDSNCLVHENFEGTINQGWLGTTDWMQTTVFPISGSKSLQQKQNLNSGISVLAVPIAFPSFGDKLIEWNFTLRSGDWDPSTDNYFYFALMADSSNIVSQKTDGFFVGITPSSGNDYLTLWKTNQGIITPLITTDFDWNPTDEVKIRVGLTPKGEWKLWYMDKHEQSYKFGGGGYSLSGSSMDWSGLAFVFSASRSGQLWIDDLSICTSDYPPVMQWAKPLNLNTVKIQFSEKVNSLNALEKANYLIFDNNGTCVDIINTSSSTDFSNGVFLKTDRLPFGRLLLKVDGIAGLNGSSIKDSIYFGLGERGSFGRLVVNEIMANPDSSLGLTANEYIELYNPTADTILLKSWKLQLNNYLLTLTNDSILPQQYAVVCSASAAPNLHKNGKSIGVSGFPALLNAGMTIKLFDPSGSLISLVNYSDTWYDDEQEREGGWSLEKIDPQNLMEGKGNWTVSLSPKGGTPCAVNSVSAENPDISPPHLLFLEVLSERMIKLRFSEPMDSLSLTYSSYYDIDNGLEHPANVSLIGGDYSSVLLTLTEDISPSIVYNLCLYEGITDFSGNQFVGDCIPFALPQKPVLNDMVVNEVLFNPNSGGVDFVEIYNRSDKTFDLNKTLLANRNGITGRLDQVYSASDTARLLFPNEYAVITTNPDLVKNFYYTENGKAFVKVSNMASFNIDQGHVVLMDNDSTVIDEVHYNENMHSKLLNDFKGVSLERINPDFESSSPSTWHSAAQTVGFATPTYKNSQWVESSKQDEEFTLSPETFSPDGDGKDDYLLISYKLPNDGSVANIRVYNAEGKEIKRLASSLLIGTQGTLTWDGLDSQNRRTPIGIYIVYIECFNPNGEIKKYKKTCVVAEKL